MIEEMFALLVDEGLKGVLVAPMLLGLETTRGLLADHRLVAIAHPSFSGAYYQHPANGIAKEILLGTLFRLVGADASIFPNFGGRFSFSRQDCRAVRDRLQPDGFDRSDRRQCLAASKDASGIALWLDLCFADSRPPLDSRSGGPASCDCLLVLHDPAARYSARRPSGRLAADRGGAARRSLSGGGSTRILPRSD